MKWSTHIRISREVLERLGIRLNDAEDERLRTGLIAPDEWKDYPHHYGKSLQIQDYLRRARGAFLNKDLLNAYYNLGVALHYIQDSYSSYPSFLNSERNKHEQWEEWIDEAYYSNNIHGTINNLKNRSEINRCSWLADELIKSVQGPEDTIRVATLNGQKKTVDSITSPIVDFNLAYRASFTVCESIFGPTELPDIEIQLTNQVKYYEKTLVEEELRVSAAVLRLAGERDSLYGSKVQKSGFVAKIKNWITDRRLAKNEVEIISHLHDYFGRSHLMAVADRYYTDAERYSRNYVGWYAFKIPELKIDVVTSELIPFDVASRTLGVDNDHLNELFRSVSASRIRIQNYDIVTRSMMNELLAKNPINGFTKYSVQV